MSTARILGTGYDEKHPDTLFASVEHPGIKPAGVARAELHPVDAIRIARGVLATLQTILDRFLLDEEEALLCAAALERVADEMRNPVRHRALAARLRGHT